MNYEERINEELKLAIKSGDKIRIETIRSIRAAIIEFNKSGLNRELNEDDFLKIINSQAKKRKDAIELYKKGNRQDLVEKEEKELKIIQEFLPQQLSEDEIKKISLDIILNLNASGPNDFGKVMGVAMKEFKGKADGKLVQQIVKELLNKNE